MRFPVGPGPRFSYKRRSGKEVPEGEVAEGQRNDHSEPIMTNKLSLFVSVLALAVAGCGDGPNPAALDAQVDHPDAGVIHDALCVCDAPNADAEVDIDADPNAPDADLTPDATPVSSDLRINEILLDQFGNDADEFLEVVGTASTDYSAFTLLVIDGDYYNTGTGRGEILNALAVGSTSADGYWVTSVNNNSFQDGTSTVLLVRDFSGAEGDDIDADDDGAIDADPPWAELIDAVAIFDDTPSSGNQDYTYAGDSVLTKVSSPSQPVAFGGASRIPDGTDTDSADDWVSNTPRFDNSGIASGEAYNTPGAENTVEP